MSPQSKLLSVLRRISKRRCGGWSGGLAPPPPPPPPPGKNFKLTVVLPIFF